MADRSASCPQCGTKLRDLTDGHTTATCLKCKSKWLLKWYDNGYTAYLDTEENRKLYKRRFGNKP